MLNDLQESLEWMELETEEDFEMLRRRIAAFPGQAVELRPCECFKLVVI